MKKIVAGTSLISFIALSSAATVLWGAVGMTDSVTNAIAVATTPNWINSPPTTVAAPKSVAPPRALALEDTLRVKSTRAIASESVDSTPGMESGGTQNQIQRSLESE